MGAGCWASHVLFFYTQPYCPSNNNEADQLNRVASEIAGTRFCVWLLSLVVALSASSGAQIPNHGATPWIHGSIVTLHGQPVANAVVEVRDLRGVRIGSSITNSAGRFEIGAVEPGKYIVLAAKELQSGDERITIGQSDLEVRITLPEVPAGAPLPSEYTVSVNQLSAPARSIKHLQSAQQRFHNRDIRGAAQEIERALEIDPHCAKAFSTLSFVKLASNDPGGAVEDALRAIALDSHDAQSYLALATSYNYLGEFEKAAEAARQALSIGPEVWQARLEMAKSFYGQNQYVPALSMLDQMNTDFPDVHLVRADVLMRLGRSREAVEQFTLFLHEAPDDPRGERIRQILSAAP